MPEPTEGAFTGEIRIVEDAVVYHQDPAKKPVVHQRVRSLKVENGLIVGLGEAKWETPPQPGR